MVLQHYVKDRVVQGLDRYVISEQVSFADVTDQHAMIQILGPNAEDFLKSKGVTPPAEALSIQTASLADVDVDVIRLGTGFAVLCAASDGTLLLDRLDAPPVGMRAFDIFRIEQGLSLLGKDVEESNFPQEGRMEGALNFNKGCYLGQEVMARIDAQGHVNKFLMGILSDRPLAAGEKLFGGEKEVGKITSAASSPMFQKTVALGYVRRELAKEGQELLAGDDRTTVISKNASHGETVGAGLVPARYGVEDTCGRFRNSKWKTSRKYWPERKRKPAGSVWTWTSPSWMTAATCWDSSAWTAPR